MYYVETAGDKRCDGHSVLSLARECAVNYARNYKLSGVIRDEGKRVVERFTFQGGPFESVMFEKEKKADV